MLLLTLTAAQQAVHSSAAAAAAPAAAQRTIPLGTTLLRLLRRQREAAGASQEPASQQPSSQTLAATQGQAQAEQRSQQQQQQQHGEDCSPVRRKRSWDDRDEATCERRFMILMDLVPESLALPCSVQLRLVVDGALRSTLEQVRTEGQGLQGLLPNDRAVWVTALAFLLPVIRQLILLYGAATCLHACCFFFCRARCRGSHTSLPESV